MHATGPGVRRERGKIPVPFSTLRRLARLGGLLTIARPVRETPRSLFLPGDRAGLFLTGEWNVCARCRLSAGIRRDELRDDFTAKHDASAWSPRAGLTVRAGALSLFAQLSHAFKAPTLDQLFDPRPYPDGTGGTFTISNPALRPQRARNIEAGVSSKHFSLVAYRMRVTDEIDFDPQTFTYRNIGSSLQHVAQLFVHAQLPHATTADVIYRWTHGMTLDDAGTFRMPDVSRVDLRLAHDVARFRVHIDVLNALDARYNEVGYVLFDFFTGAYEPLQFPPRGERCVSEVRGDSERRASFTKARQGVDDLALLYANLPL